MSSLAKIAAAVIVLSIPTLLLVDKPTSGEIISPISSVIPSTNQEPSASPLVLVTQPQAPVKLIIPKLQVNTVIEPVGEDSTGRMATPEEVMNVSWWMHGTKPGDIGNAVLAGHLDTQTGDPAIFYRLSELESGDQVVIIDQTGIEHQFEVYDKQTFTDAQFPIDLVFTHDSIKGLNLITCSGSWDKTNKNYLERLVVFTKQVET